MKEAWVKKEGKKAPHLIYAPLAVQDILKFFFFLLGVTALFSSFIPFHTCSF
jgi:hypothetical protein